MMLVGQWSGALRRPTSTTAVRELPVREGDAP